jgi:hypothetical protein
MSQLAELTTITQKRFQCRHVHAAGRQCGSPALRNEEFCYFHHTTRSRKKTGGFRYLDATEPFELPLVEDRVSALSAAAQIFCRIAHLASEMWVPQNSAPQPDLVEDLILDETHGLIAPITELPEPTASRYPEDLSSGLSSPAEEGVSTPGVQAAPTNNEERITDTVLTNPRTSPRPPKRIYTDEEKDFLKWTTSSTHYAPVHRRRPGSITDDDIIAAINANRRRCSLGPIDTDPNWNKATLSADPVDPSDPPFLSSAKPVNPPRPQRRSLRRTYNEQRTL